MAKYLGLIPQISPHMFCRYSATLLILQHFVLRCKHKLICTFTDITNRNGMYNLWQLQDQSLAWQSLLQPW